MRAAQERFEVSERVACRWLDVNRKLFHYDPAGRLMSRYVYGQRRLIVLARRFGRPAYEIVTPIRCRNYSR